MMKYRVLIVDDDPQIRKFINSACKKLGWAADEGEDGNAGMELLKENQYDLCVFDMVMPGPSGLELAEVACRKTCHPAILILTGHPAVDIAVHAIRKGVYDYIQKPIEPEELQNELIRAARYREGCIRVLKARQAREQTVHDIQEQNQRFRSMLELCYDAIFLADYESGKVLDCNLKACEILGCKKDDILESNVLNYLNLPIFDDWEMFAKSVYDEQTIIFEGELISKYRKAISAEFAVSMAFLTADRLIVIVARDISERKMVEEALQNERNNTLVKASRLNSMLDHLNDAVVFLDNTRCIAEANDSFLDMVRTPRELVLGAHYSTILHEYNDSIETMFKQHEKGKIPENMSSTSKFRNMQKSICIHPVHDNGEFHGIMLTWTDVGEYLEARDAAEVEKDQQKDVLIQLMDDMQTELESINNALDEALQYEKTDLGHQILLESARDCAHTVTSLIVDVQDAMEIDVRKLRNEKSAFDIGEIARAAIRSCRNNPNLPEHDIELLLDCTMVQTFSGYADHLRQALSTLLEDACKAMQDRRLFLTIVEETENNGISLQICISNRKLTLENRRTDHDADSFRKDNYPGPDAHVWYLKGLVAMNGGRVWSVMNANQLQSLCLQVKVTENEQQHNER